jgi:hypothetical protein
VATVTAALSRCSPGSTVVSEAESALAKHERMRNPWASAEADLDLFERTWARRHELCGPSTQFPQHIELLAAELTK